jgi:hypothetical protein
LVIVIQIMQCTQNTYYNHSLRKMRIATDSLNHNSIYFSNFLCSINYTFPRIEPQSHTATDGWSVGQFVCLGVEHRLGLMTRFFFLFESYCPVHMGRPVWREVGVCHLSVIVGSISPCQYVQIFTSLHILCDLTYNIYKVSQSMLSTANYALFLVVFAKMAV